MRKITIKTFIALASVFAIAIFMSSCSQESISPTSFENQFDVFIVPTGDNGPATLEPNVTYCGTPKVVDFFAGQTIDAGSVTIYNDNTNLYVTVYSAYGYQSGTEQIKMWVGADTSTIPKNTQGVPTIGQFPYKITTAGGTTYTFTIPLNDLQLVNQCGDPIFLVIHGDVFSSTDGGVTLEGNTAFGGDIGGNTGNRWWYLTSYSIQCCEGNPPSFDHEETAFAKGGWVWTTMRKSNPENLPSLNLTKNRWGWAINLPFSDGSHTYDIWAGAGLNDTTKGTKAGTLTVVLSGNNVTVTYNLFSGFTMNEIHVYADDFKPTTLAPGQYGYTEYFSPNATTASTTFTLYDTNSDGIWIIAHAVVQY